jgi:hypothetical protein
VTRVTETAPGHLSISCECGKPLTVATSDGMFCEDRHGEEASKAARSRLEDLVAMFVPKS